MVKTGANFDNFIVVMKKKEAVSRWSSYHNSCNFYETMADGLEKNIFGCCLDDEYEEMKEDQYIMGVGLYAYQQSMRRA